MLSVVVRREDVSDAEREALAHGALIAPLDRYVRYELTGKGRVAVLQGIVSCDVAAAGPANRFGALLTNKGMIVTPLWITLLGDRILVEAPEEVGTVLGDTFLKTMPPRLCRARDVTTATATFLSFGAKPVPLSGPPAAVRGTGGIYHLTDTGMAGGFAVFASEALLERCRIEAMIPRLGAEIDDRTLPQEVGLDVLGGVSFTKGCYIGQETVARLKYRGHANRRLVSLDLDIEPASVPADLTLDGKPAGRLTSAAWSDAANGWIALAVVRRDVADGAALAVHAGGGGPSGARGPGVAVVRGERRLREP